ncbi:hypothetical protein ALMP_72370 [Streptomyces sp. A012304]|nr:hypothetical protein ALMP_72370 [Streptomyces sp. A012304]
MARWAAAGVIGQIRDQLRKRIRRDMGRSPGAVATVIDSQSVKAAETIGRDSRGYDVAKRINVRRARTATLPSEVEPGGGPCPAPPAAAG